MNEIKNYWTKGHLMQELPTGKRVYIEENDLLLFFNNSNQIVDIYKVVGISRRLGDDEFLVSTKRYYKGKFKPGKTDNIELKFAWNCIKKSLDSGHCQILHIMDQR